MSSEIDQPFRYGPLSVDNVAEVAELEALVSPEPWSESLFAGELGMHASARNWLVLRDGAAAVVGFGGMMFVENEGHLMNIAVHPDRRRNGHAADLLVRLTNDAIVRGITDITLEVRSNNDAALALYRRFGYAPAGLRRKYYVDGQDAIIMWANDIDSSTYSHRLTQAVAQQTPAIERATNR